MELNIKEIRKRAILTQPEFAEKLGVSTNTISEWELGKKRPSIKNTRKIIEFCKNHNIPLEW